MDGQIVDVLQFALDGVQQQQTSVANNLANLDTPNYTDTETTFQQSLTQALDASGGGTATITDVPSTSAAGTDGNNVDLASELTEAEQSTLQYQALSESINAQFRLVQGASGGSFT
ncbi:MAG TPA: flagellar basal body protein [Acidimicrobiales bacterium]|nr:flagellar basal body protein [Acidimicrobiales bacterium]